MRNSDNTNTPPALAHPYLEGMVVVGCITGLFGLITAVLAGLGVIGIVDITWTILAVINLGFWVMILLVMGIWGMIKLQQMRDFVWSSRPRIRWTYTQDEWAPILGEQESDRHEMSFVAPGCLAVLFGIAGLMVGVMLGIDEGSMGSIITLGGMWLLIGVSIGGGLGGTIAASNYLAYHVLRGRDRRPYVALGETEILYGNNYFRSNGITRSITQVQLKRVTDSPLPLLVIKLLNPKPRGGSQETWEIPIPTRMIEPLTSILPDIRTGEWR